MKNLHTKRSVQRKKFWLADLANVNESKKWVADVSQKVCITGSLFVFAFPAGMLFTSETNIEPDLRLTRPLLPLGNKEYTNHLFLTPFQAVYH